jgi:hypothetical protein
MVMKKIKIAKLLNVKVNNSTGQVFLEMEVVDPVWRSKFLQKWQDMDAYIVVEEKDADL